MADANKIVDALARLRLLVSDCGNQGDLRDVETLAAAIVALGAQANLARDTNDLARQLADVRDERDTARASAENLRVAVASRENVILKVEALLYQWEQDGKGDGLHGKQLRQVIEGERQL